jgi:alpha-tubulin suppressor-like RCC1 family protein
MKRVRIMGLCLVAVFMVSAMVAATASAASSAAAWGFNGNGQLGNGTVTSSDVPVAVSGLSGVTAISGGSFHSLALLSNGTVMAWGANNVGQLGNGTVTDSHVPVAVSGLGGVTAIAAGANHSLALLSNGTVMAWGYNGTGQLGNGTTTSSHVPVAVSGLSGVTAISASREYSLALLSNGTVMAWGYNFYGQLGNGTTTDSHVPVAVCAAGTVGTCPTGPYLSGVTAISAGSYHSLALLSNGTVMAWGNNIFGELGNGTTTKSNVPVAVSGLSGVTAISAGSWHSLALLSNGTVMAWGYNGNGQLGNGTGTDSHVPVAVSGLGGVTAISAGERHSLALLSNATVMAWGFNQYGQLGNGTTTSSLVPVAVSGLKGVTAISGGLYHSLAVRAEPPWVINGGLLPEGVEKPTISWGDLSLKGATEINCHNDIGGTVENPVGGGAGIGFIYDFSAFLCTSPNITCPVGFYVAVEPRNLPWITEIIIVSGKVRNNVIGVRVRIGCRTLSPAPTGAGENEVIGTTFVIGPGQKQTPLAPFGPLKGTSALNPGKYSYDAGSGELEEEGSGGAAKAVVEGEVKTLGYNEQELIQLNK